MRLLNTVLLLVTALTLAAGNLWFAAARSTIPLDLDGTVESVEMRREKHPGKDDVFLLTLDSGQVIQIDRGVADNIVVGAHIKKTAWSRNLQIGSQDVELDWSADFRGMTQAMPAVLFTLIATAVLVNLARKNIIIEPRG